MERSPRNISYFSPSWDSGFGGGGGGEAPFFSAPGHGRESRAAAALPFSHSSPRSQQKPARTKETGVEKIRTSSGLAPRVGPGGSEGEAAFLAAPGGCSPARAGPGQVSISPGEAHHVPGRNRSAVSLAFWGVEPGAGLGLGSASR